MVDPVGQCLSAGRISALRLCLGLGVKCQGWWKISLVRNFRWCFFFGGEHIMGGGTHWKKLQAVLLIFFLGKSSFFSNINVSINKLVGYDESSTIFSQSQSRFGVYTLPETKSSLLKMLSGPALFSGAFPASFREGNHPKKMGFEPPSSSWCFGFWMNIKNFNKWRCSSTNAW